MFKIMLHHLAVMLAAHITSLFSTYSALKTQHQPASPGAFSLQDAVCTCAKLTCGANLTHTSVIQFCQSVAVKTANANKLALQAGSSAGLAKNEMWRAAAHNLELSDQQRKALCHLRRLFMQKQEALIEHRQNSIAALQAAMPNAASSHDIATQFLKVSPAVLSVSQL